MDSLWLFCLPFTVFSITSETGLVKAAKELQTAGWAKRKHLKPKAMTEDNPCEHQLSPRILAKDSYDRGSGGGADAVTSRGGAAAQAQCATGGLAAGSIAADASRAPSTAE